MSYNSQRFEALMRLGIEQLPSLPSSPRSSCDFEEIAPLSRENSFEVPLRELPVPGKRCGACLARGQTVWVIPGKRCPQCGAEVN